MTSTLNPKVLHCVFVTLLKHLSPQIALSSLVLDLPLRQDGMRRLLNVTLIYLMASLAHIKGQETLTRLRECYCIRNHECAFVKFFVLIHFHFSGRVLGCLNKPSLNPSPWKTSVGLVLLYERRIPILDLGSFEIGKSSLLN